MLVVRGCVKKYVTSDTNVTNVMLWVETVSFSDFGLQFLVVIILHSLTSYFKGCRFPGKVYTILISFTSYLKYKLMPLTENNSMSGIFLFVLEIY